MAGAADHSSRRTLRAIPIIIVLAVGAAGLAGLAFSPWLSSPCSDRVVREFPSDGPAVAVVFVSSCGATTPFVSSVLVRGKEMRFEPKSEDVFFMIRSEPEAIEVRWPNHVLDGRTRLEIVYPRGAEVFRQAIRWQGMTIEYRER